MSRDRRALMLGTAVVAVAWVFVRGAPNALHSLAQKEEETAQRADLLGRTRERVRRLPLIDDSIRALNEVATEIPHMLLVGGDRETAAVDLMSRLRDEFEPHEVTVEGFAPRSVSETSGPLILASISVSVETDFPELLELIAELEEDPALAVESVEIRTTDAHSREGRPEVITAELGVSGWYRNSGESELASQGIR